MGWHAARKLRTGLDCFRDVIAIELLAAARALALRAPLTPSPVTGAVADRVNALSGGPGHDRWLSPEIAAVSELVASRELLDVASRYVTLQ
jgi:histidine ammonia-lyase